MPTGNEENRNLTEAQRRRALQHADSIVWDDQVVDPRDARGRIHPHKGMLNLLMAAFACGLVTLRRAENLAEDLGRKARRMLGLPGKVSDTTLFRMLASQGPEGMRETVQTYVRTMMAKQEVRNDLFPIGVMSCDGKSNWTSTSHGVEGARESSGGVEQQPVWMLGSVRAALTSSSIRPCVDLEFIGAKEGESPAFRTMFPRVCHAFGDAFEVVTGDAGLTCRENASVVREAGKHYVFGLKGNQPHLHSIATQSTDWSLIRATTTDRANGKTVVRDLYKLAVTHDERVDFADARQLWCVRQTTILPDETKVESRYFVTSLPSGHLSPSHELSLVRLHWGIENGLNWTLDMALLEDDAQPCQVSRQALEVVGWLRTLAYNLLSKWRCRLPLKDRRPMPWARVMEKLRDSLICDGVGGDALFVTFA